LHKDLELRILNYKSDDIEYAIENSRILREPDRRIDTFGDTKFKFITLSVVMDNPSQTRIRTGEMEAQKPTIIRPEGFNDVELEGFNEKAREFLDMLRSKGLEPAVFKYGFQFKRTEAHEELLNETFDNVKDKLLEQAKAEGDPMLAVIEAVDDTWEVGLLKFSIDMISKSTEINTFDFRRKGLL